jgi:hypothetical protein
MNRTFVKASSILCRSFSAGTNVMQNQHMRYVPKTRLKFDYKSGDGPLSLIFEAGDEGGFKKFVPHTWKVTLATNLPAIYYASITLGAQYNYIYPAMALPTIYYFIIGMRAQKEYLNLVQKMWLLKNGDQVVLLTFDGVMHKLNIVHNTEHEIQTAKKELIFVMTNCNRDFKMSNKEAKYIDYDLVDRIIHSVPIDTKKF